MSRILKFTLFLFVSVAVFGCNNSKPSKTITQFGEINVISPADFKEKSANHTIIDVRTPGEFSEGHIEGAININFFDKNFLEEMAKFNTNEPVFIYCKSGNRSSSAIKKMSDLGFVQVNELQGGILNWQRSNQPIIK
jgi:rhodanese-related sulfurtransferase